MRRIQAAETREAVLAAAKNLFFERGWVKTTIAAVAEAAGISKETIYSTFGNKTTLLREIISRAVRGTDPETPLIHQVAARSIAEETDQARQIELFAEEIAKILARVAPLMDIVRTAAGSDAEIASFYRELHRGRRANLDWFAHALLRNDSLRDDVDAEAATGVLWRLASPDLYLLMRNVEGTSQQAYVKWLTSTLKILLLRH